MNQHYEPKSVAIKCNKEQGKCALVWSDENGKVVMTWVFPAQGVPMLLSELLKVEGELQKGNPVADRTGEIITKYEASPAAPGVQQVGIFIESAPSSESAPSMRLFAIEAEEAKSFAEEIRRAAELAAPNIEL